MQANALRDEVIQLKTLLMMHKDCPVNQAAVQDALNRPIPGIFDPSLPNPPPLTLLKSTHSNTVASNSSASPPPSSINTTTN